MDGMQNPQTVDNSAPTEGTDTGTTPNGEGLSLAQAMGYDMNDTKPTAADEPKTDTSDAVEGSGSHNDEPKAPTWLEQLSDDLKGDEKAVKTLSKFNNVTDLAKSYTELQKLMGNRVELPKKDADSDALTAFWTKLGKPKTAEEYTIEDKVGTFKQLAYDANLTNDQANSVFKALKDLGMTVAQNQREALKAQYENVDRSLHEKYGNQYDTKKRMLDKGIKAWGGNEVAQVLINSGAMFNEAVVDMFIKMGEAANESGAYNKAGNGTLSDYKSRKDGGGFKVTL